MAVLGVIRLLLPAVLLALSLIWTARHPYGVVMATASALWLLWPLVGFGWFDRSTRDPSALRLALRYVGGHPACPAPGRALLTVWPGDGAATLRVGRHVVAFPLSAVRSVALADGRIELPTGTRGWPAEILGRLMARGVGRFCGLRRAPSGDLAVVDRSRVICDLARSPGPCRLVLIGPRGGGEDVYLEVLVLLRPSGTGSGAGAPGGTRGGQTLGGL